VAAFTETYTSSHEEWLEQRNKGLGGSDAAAILGLNGYKTPYGVWLEKTGRVTPVDISDKEAVYWGTVLEDVVAHEFAKRHADMSVRRKNATLASKDRPWQLANVDRVIKDTRGRWGVLEIKTAGTFRADDWAEGIPDYYLPQCIHYLAVTGFEFFAVACLIGGQHYVEYFYERDEEDVAYLNDQEAAFWNEHVLADKMPPVSAGDGDALIGQHPCAGDEYLQMLDDDVPQIEELQDVTALIKRLEADKKRLANELKVLIGDSAGIQTPTMRVTWPRSECTSFDTKAFKAAEPELAKKYEVTKPKDGGIRMTAKKGA
jgi:putative phage-type endonuclease